MLRVWYPRLEAVILLRSPSLSPVELTTFSYRHLHQEHLIRGALSWLSYDGWLLHSGTENGSVSWAACSSRPLAAIPYLGACCHLPSGLFISCSSSSLQHWLQHEVGFSVRSPCLERCSCEACGKCSWLLRLGYRSRWLRGEPVANVSFHSGASNACSLCSSTDHGLPAV